MEHTPTPWHVGPYYKGDIESPSGHVGTMPMHPQGQANAAHIVRCVNDHNKLVAAVQAVEKFLNDINAVPPWESAGAIWAQRIQELHAAWLPAKEALTEKEPT